MTRLAAFSLSALFTVAMLGSIGVLAAVEPAPSSLVAAAPALHG